MRHRDDKKRAAVCQAAISLINELGLDGVSMSKIAKRANVSPATIYIYFKEHTTLKSEVIIILYKLRSLERLEAMLKFQHFYKVCWISTQPLPDPVDGKLENDEVPLPSKNGWTTGPMQLMKTR